MYAYSVNNSSMFKNKTLEYLLLNFLSREKILLSIYLQNGIKLDGTIKIFDNNILLLQNSKSQIIYKNSISTICPKKDIDISQIKGL